MANKFLDSTGLTHLWSKISSKFLSKAEGDSKYLKLSGGTLTGNLNGKYLTGTWLQTTAVTNKGSAAKKIAIIDDAGWVYYRTAKEILEDIGAASAASGADPYKVGDILYTARTDLGDKWLLCNGDGISSDEYPELYSVIPDAEYPILWMEPLSGSEVTRITDVYKSSTGYVYLLGNNGYGNGKSYIVQLEEISGNIRKVIEFTIPEVVSSSVVSSLGSICVGGGKIYIGLQSGTGTLYQATFNEDTGVIGSFTKALSSVSNTSPSGFFHRYVNGKHFIIDRYYNGFTLLRVRYGTSLSSLTSISNISFNLDTYYQSIRGVYMDSNDNIWVYTESTGHAYKAYIGINASSNSMIASSSFNTNSSLSIMECDNLLYFISSNHNYSYPEFIAYNLSSNYAVVGRNTNTSYTNVNRIVSYNGNLYARNYNSSDGNSLVKLSFNSSNNLELETLVDYDSYSDFIKTSTINYSINESSVISLQPNSPVLYYLVPKRLPSISVDGAYAYIRAKESDDNA